MTTEQFIAWFDGFTSRIKGRPSNKDWKEIIAAVARIDGPSPLKAWFEGLLIKVKTAPSESEWSEIRRRVGDAQPAAQKSKLGVNESFKAFSKKASPGETKPASKTSYPGAGKPFGKK